jgi:two-component system chemotaxis response regulator CheB
MMTGGATSATGAARYRAVVVGGSAGGLKALVDILSEIPAHFGLPVLVVQHLHASDGGALARHLARETSLPVVEPCDKERIEPGCVYVAPADYHMLVERSGTIALSVEERVNWSRPSIDVLFESAASAWGRSVIAIILSGANSDGAKGAQAVKAAGGLVIAQDADEAQHPFMPRAAIDARVVDEVLRAKEIGRRVAELGVRTSP